MDDEFQGGQCGTHHETQVAPLVEKVAVDIDAVGLAQVLSYESSDGRQVGGLVRVLILNVFEMAWYLIARNGLTGIHVHHGCECLSDLLHSGFQVRPGERVIIHRRCTRGDLESRE